MGKLLRYFAIFTVLVALAACDSGLDEQSVSGGNSGAGGALPPGVIITQGTGGVVDLQTAITRFLQQFIGIQPRLLARAQVVGEGTAPLVNAYLVPRGPFPAGTRVSGFDRPQDGFVLDQPYYLFWVDPNPLADLGHECYIVYLRASDGLMVQQTVDFDPLVGGVRSLELPSVKEENLIYTHSRWRDLGLAPGEPPVATREQVLSQGVGQPGGPKVAGLGVAGSPEDRRTFDLAAGAVLLTEMGGAVTDFDTLRDREGDRKDGFDLEEALAKASEGLGPNDKFLFVLSSHGSQEGRFSMGTDTLTWQELCQLIDQNVTAGNINLVIHTCYSGLAVAEFEKWRPTSTKRVKIITTTSEDAPGYGNPEGVSFNLKCVIDKLKMLLDAAATDGELTIDEIEAAMEGVEVSQEELDKKICDYIGDVPGTELPPELRAWKNDYLDEPGAEDEVDRTKPGKKGGFDRRPTGPERLFEFIDRWRTTINNHPQNGFILPYLELEAFYPSNFIYDGNNVSQLNRLGAGIRHDLGTPTLGPTTVDPSSGQVKIEFMIHDNITVGGANPVSQSEEIQIQMHLLPLSSIPSGEPPFDILRQSVLLQTTQGTTGTNPPPLPPVPTIQALNFTAAGNPLMPDDPVSSGDPIQGDATVTGLQAQNSSVGSVFVGQLVNFVPFQGGFRGNFQVPPNLPTETFEIHFFAQNRNIGTNGEAFSSVSRSLPLSVNPNL